MPYSIGSITGSSGGFGEYDVVWLDDNLKDWRDVAGDAEAMYEDGDADAPAEAQEAIDKVKGAIHNEPDVLFAFRYPGDVAWTVYGYNEIPA